MFHFLQFSAALLEMKFIIGDFVMSKHNRLNSSEKTWHLNFWRHVVFQKGVIYKTTPVLHNYSKKSSFWVMII